MSPDSETYRATRVEIYSDWLADDVDGLIANIKPPFALRHHAATAILAGARERIAEALDHIDQAIAADRAAHAAAEKEPA